jgi:glycerol-3-phosphate O-acyltransferase
MIRKWLKEAGSELAKAGVELNRFSQMTAALQTEISEWRAVFAAKLLRDNLRAEHFLRQTAEKFQECAKRTIWALNRDQFTEADEAVANLKTQVVQDNRSGGK